MTLSIWKLADRRAAVADLDPDDGDVQAGVSQRASA